MEGKEKYFTVIVGRDGIGPEFLIAPENYYFDVDDVVVSRGGHKYTVEFVNTYTHVASQLFIALEKALGGPVRIEKRIVEEKIKWGDTDETDTNTACCGDCRSGECRDGDRVIIQ